MIVSQEGASAIQLGSPRPHANMSAKHLFSNMTKLVILRASSFAAKRCFRTAPVITQSVQASNHVSLDNSQKLVTVHWEGQGSSSCYNAVWLRHNCHCPECKQVGSGQKIMNMFAHPPSDVVVKDAKVDGDKLSITWGDHSGYAPIEWLKLNDYSEESLQRKSTQATPTFMKGDMPKLSYDRLETEDGVWEWIEALNDVGLCLITNIPNENSSVLESIVEKICPSLRTIYGPGATDVKAVTSNPANIAYSTSELPLHMDFPYYESIPGLQFLRCIRFDDCVIGGESVLLDTYLVAEEFRQEHPDLFDTLVRLPATFQKIHYDRGYPVHMVYQRPHIELNTRKQIRGIVWSPAFEGALSLPPTEINAYYEAYYQFGKRIYESPHTIVQRLKEGEMISFNNKRMLHGRRAFSLHGGMRHFEVAYAHSDEFQSKVHLLAQRLRKGPVKRIFNNCNF